jgi:hypothetical protein
MFRNILQECHATEYAIYNLLISQELFTDLCLISQMLYYPVSQSPSSEDHYSYTTTEPSLILPPCRQHFLLGDRDQNITKKLLQHKIRLLKIHPGEFENAVECSMITTSLKHLFLHYKCVSYTWEIMRCQEKPIVPPFIFIPNSYTLQVARYKNTSSPTSPAILVH